MISDVPTIVIRFDIEKTGTGHHCCFTCWKIFWQTIHPEQIGLATLWEGETAATFCGEEQVYCIAVQSPDNNAISRIRDALIRSEPFKRICASPMFVEGAACAAESLVDACRIDMRGSLLGYPGKSVDG